MGSGHRDHDHSGIMAQMDREKKWHRRFMEIAQQVAQWSKDPSKNVGAVIVDHKRRIIATGYNGFPRGVKDSPKLLLDRESKYARVVHAELNAILNSVGSVEGCALYTTFPPCCECAKAIIQSGIRVVYVPHGTDTGTWKHSTDTASDMFNEVGIPLHAIQ